MKKKLLQQTMAALLAAGMLTTTVGMDQNVFASTTLMSVSDISYSTLQVGTTKSFQFLAGGSKSYYQFTTDEKDAFYTVKLSVKGTSETGTSIMMYSGPDFLDEECMIDQYVHVGSSETYELEKECKPNTTYYLVLEQNNTEQSSSGSLLVTQYVDDKPDQAEQAVGFSVGNEATGYINCNVDEDYWKFTTDGSDSFYFFDISAIGNKGRTEYRIYDNMELLDEDILCDGTVWNGRTNNEHLGKRLLPNHTYYVKVGTGDEIDRENPLKYTLKVRKYKDDRGDSISNASPFSVGNTITGWINDEDDVDYVRFTTDGSDAFYSIDLSAIGEKGRYSYWIYNSKEMLDDNVVYDGDVWNGRKEVLNLKKNLKPNTTYFIKVGSPYDLTADKPLKYELSVKQYKDDVKDSVAAAKTVKVGSLSSYKLQNGSDQDFFKITFDRTDSFYSLFIQNLSSNQRFRYVLFKDKNCTEEIDGGTIWSKTNNNIDLVKKIKPGSTCYLKIFEDSDDIVTIPYKFKFIQIKDDVKDRGTAAKSISLDKTYSYKIQNSEDEDWFKFTTANYTDYLVNMQNITKNSDCRISVYKDKNGINELYSRFLGSKSSLKGTDRELKLTPYKTYYIKVTGSIANYKLNISPKGPDTTTLEAKKGTKKKIVVRWSKVNKATGYEVWKATKNGKFKKVKTIKSAKTVSFTDSSVKKGNTYKYKVRAYAKKGKSTYYSGFSAIKSMKVK